ncbi:hypothetical protein ACLOJK_040465 [Asimina triloba]
MLRLRSSDRVLVVGGFAEDEGDAAAAAGTVRMMSASVRACRILKGSLSPSFCLVSIVYPLLPEKTVGRQPWLSLSVGMMEHRTLVLRRCTNSDVPQLRNASKNRTSSGKPTSSASIFFVASSRTSYEHNRKSMAPRPSVYDEPSTKSSQKDVMEHAKECFFSNYNDVDIQTKNEDANPRSSIINSTFISIKGIGPVKLSLDPDP